MSRDTIRCQKCGKSVTPEEVEAGISVICPTCSDSSKESADCCTEEESKGGDCGCCGG